VILYAYNAAGDLLGITDGNGNKTSWGYDIYGRVTSKTNANGTEILRYQYDANGRVTNRWSLAKGNTQYRYDSAGNLTNVVYSSSPAISMQYDANNRLTHMVDGVGATSFTYTDFGAILSEDGPWGSDTITYSYTANRLRSKLSLLQPNAAP
jgi:YD repeat-containing protein